MLDTDTPPNDTAVPEGHASEPSGHASDPGKIPATPSNSNGHAKTHAAQPVPLHEASSMQMLLQFLIGFVLPVAIVVSAALFGKHLLDTAPTVQRHPKERLAQAVDAYAPTPTTQPIVIDAMGQVVASRELGLTPQIGGQITWMSDKLVPGGVFAAGEVMARLDNADYQIIVRQRQAQLAQVQADLRVEQGQQAVARQDYELLGQELTEDQMALVLRQPQLAALQANLDQAQAQLDAAELDLSRTEIKAPFNLRVTERLVEVGTQVSSGTALANLVGTDRFWVRAQVPVSDLRWLNLPSEDNQTSSDANANQASVATIRNPTVWAADATREGHVVALEPMLETSGRMAQMLIAVDQPLVSTDPIQHPPLLIGSYVQIHIEGKQAESIYAVDRKHVRDGQVLWVMDANNQLRLQPANILYSGREQVLIQGGLQTGDRIVTSNIPAPVAKMPLRLYENSTPAVEGQNP